MNNVYQKKTASLELKDVDSVKGIVSGYFSAFGNVDADGDMIVQGAYSKTIKENFNRIKHLLNHNAAQPLGKILELKEDSHGLFYRSQIGTHALGRDFLKMLESELIKEHSVGYQIVKNEDDREMRWNRDGITMTGVNKITEMKLWEGSSLTAWGANSNTPITEVKGVADVEDIATRIKALEKFCKDSDATDETIQLLWIQIKQLQQLIIDSTQPVKTVEPQKDEKLNDQIKLLILKHYN